MDKAALPNQTEAPRYDWRTPRPIVELVEWILGVRFDLDAFAEPHNTHCERFLTGPCLGDGGEPDGSPCRSCGFCASWAGATVWANPPYGSDLARFARKFYREAPHARLIAGLVSPAMSQEYTHEFLFPVAREIWPITPRIQFEAPPGRSAGNSNRYDSVVYIARPGRRLGGLVFRPLDWRRALTAARNAGAISS